MIAVPEPDLTERELIERAVAMRSTLLERQAETERLTVYPKETHEDFLRAGFYRTLQPRRYGGYEFDVSTFYRVVTEVTRGCPSTGWALSLSSAHVLQVASFFGEQAQDELFGDDGDFRAASTIAPIGMAVPDGDGHITLDGTWPYSSGSPYATHYLAQTFRAPANPGDRPGPPVLFVAPRSAWTLLDDWYGTLGLRGSGSNSLRFDKARVPDHHTLDGVLLALPVEGGTVGSQLHGQSMYAGCPGSFFQGEMAALLIGTAYAAADEYTRIISERRLVMDPTHTRADLHDYQRHLGEALAAINTADAAMRATAADWTRACADNVSGRAPFTTADDDRFSLVYLNAGRMAWDALQGILFRTAGSRHARNGERMQRYFRDAATMWTHVCSTMSEPLARRVGRARLGLPTEDIPLVS
ncbi:acyl-CoA dehydrogenase family protein [Streptomyces cadmiisoli]|uniref:Acyl-CoA dehydrogenase n=1 Tax=Streptomyces cadmiisoli TaxID=2184053 RepID=A0A2Z4JEB1_9ACTN|nr:acyl-CoA dehydrogenase family protein [Streptomyces cadmiisoli]AWW43317.1 acyl-CoA dehydrogenase [Streptomyces cadmiisoli]